MARIRSTCPIRFKLILIHSVSSFPSSQLELSPNLLTNQAGSSLDTRVHFKSDSILASYSSQRSARLLLQKHHTAAPSIVFDVRESLLSWPSCARAAKLSTRRFCVSSSRWRPRERETLGREERRVHVANDAAAAFELRLRTLRRCSVPIIVNLRSVGFVSYFLPYPTCLAGENNVRGVYGSLLNTTGRSEVTEGRPALWSDILCNICMAPSCSRAHAEGSSTSLNQPFSCFFPSYLDVDCRFELNSRPVQMVSNFYSAALVFLALAFGTMCITFWDRNHSIFFSRSTSGAWMVRDWTHEALLFAINCR
ncbi:hypothetical protein C8R45DRAFT_934517 [Mycena sanguinolenta]|nr:hypothetical protein C8R45DRAFT_934517 [Mycena sanguinolenta]